MTKTTDDMNLRHNFLLLAALAIALLGWVGCVDQDFDEPPVRGLPSLTANVTIQQLKDLHTLGNTATEVTEDWIVSGIVVADDESGNLYQQLIIEDETGGIAVRLRSNGLYTLYPVGTEVFLKMKGLFVGDFNNFYQISGDAEGNTIESVLIPEYLVAGEQDKEVIPTATTLDDLINDQTVFDDLLSRLVVLEDVQFSSFELGGTFAVPGGGSGRNKTIEDCNGNTIILRNSDFADFAGDPLPEGNGPLTAVVTVFGSTKQLLIRYASDADFQGERCGSGGQGGDLISIEDLRSNYSGTTTEAPADSKIRGVVISDAANGNINGQNIFIQDGTAGIVVRFSDFHNFDLGDEVEISVGGQELSDFNGLVQVNNVPLTNASLLGDGTLPTPRDATISEILANVDTWESTLVRVMDVSISGGGTFAGNLTVTDASGSIAMFTLNGASFANLPVPTTTGNLTAIVSDFNGTQIILRNADDIDFEGGGGGDPTLISAADLRDLFESGAGNAPAAKLLRGIVISDVDNGNLTGRNVVIQDESGGIVVRFTDEHNFALGEEVEINVSNMEFNEFNGLLQVNNVPNSNAVSFGPGTLPAPRETTFEEINENAEEWESTLVIVENVSFTESGTYSGNKPMDDETDTINLYTRPQASFASANVPSGTFTLVAIVSQFDDIQLNIRNLNDIME